MQYKKMMQFIAMILKFSFESRKKPYFLVFFVLKCTLEKGVKKLDLNAEKHHL